ncbi:LysR family transcriptional regulator [Celerinatantimonas diazotrophica]|uniref:LysR family transcriptional regulator n=1 Tax=Celerinatantimonas diazotrophica TaxID=412034 RepID=A0A4R1JLT4_9GAMM|nr:LysR family transcriptional regulator [Celerinatantimonas diazotrophica]TCK52022.1 LysR family transcriptional regulator [Celerinatantimonas diazotrophica]CAG9296275.1 HTH-type transcriptional regulator GltC [Celerinatantimonas diazotrophica]
MDIKALRYFVELVKQKSFTKASQKLFVTQPTISKMIKNLEVELDLPLLHRDGRRFWLTDAGEVVFQKAQGILSQMDELVTELDDLNELRKGRLKVGIPPMIGHMYAGIIRQYRQLYPDVELVILEYGGRKVEQAVLDGELDVAITMLSEYIGNELATLEFNSYPVYAVLSDMPNWRRKSTVRWSELAEESFFVYTDEFTLSGSIRQACQKAGFTPQIAARSSQWDFLVALVKTGGVAFVPEPLCRRMDHNGLLIRPIEPTINWDLGVIWHAQRYLSKAAQAWIDLCYYYKKTFIAKS